VNDVSISNSDGDYMRSVVLEPGSMRSHMGGGT
jgi:hypothetical protein